MERQLEVTCDCCNAEHVISVDERGKPTRLNKMEVAYVEVEGVAGIVVVGQLKDGSACDHVGKMKFDPLHCTCCGLAGEVIFSLRALTTSIPNIYLKEQPSDYVNDCLRPLDNLEHGRMLLKAEPEIDPNSIISHKWGEATADLPRNLLEVDRALALSQGTVRLGGSTFQSSPNSGFRSASSPGGPGEPWVKPEFKNLSQYDKDFLQLLIHKASVEFPSAVVARLMARYWIGYALSKEGREQLAAAETFEPPLGRQLDCIRLINELLTKAGVPTHHPLKEGCQLPKPMMPQERVEWLIRNGAVLSTGRDEWKVLGLNRLKEVREEINTAIYDLENKRA